MNDKGVFRILLVLSLSLIIGLITFAIRSGVRHTAIWIILGILIVIAFLAILLRRKYVDIREGIPLKDERTKKVKLYAAGYAYVVSIYIWLLLLAFQKYLESDDLILIGMFGMVISFGISWLIMNNKKDLE